MEEFVGLRSALKKIFKRDSRPVSSNDESFWNYVFGNSKTKSGTTISERDSICIPVVWACIRIISDCVSVLPLKLYKRVGEGREEASEHPVNTLLNDPNPEMTQCVYQKLGITHQMTWGNQYSYIVSDKGGRPRQLWPLMPDRTTVHRSTDNGDLYFQTIDRNGKTITIMPDKILHIPGMSFDGVVGKSVIGAHRETLGLSVAATEFGARFFGNGANPKGILSISGTLRDEEQVKRLRESFTSMYSGLENSHNIAVLEQGTKYDQLTINPNDAQFLETRTFQKEEIATIFGVPLALLQMMEKSTSWGAGIEQLMIAFVKMTLLPYLVRTEQAIDKKLLTPDERKVYYTKFNVEGLMRGDFKNRMDGYKVGIDGGWMSINDIRKLEDMNPVSGGDQHYRPLNYTSINEKGKNPKAGVN